MKMKFNQRAKSGVTGRLEVKRFIRDKLGILTMGGRIVSYRNE